MKTSILTSLFFLLLVFESVAGNETATITIKIKNVKEKTGSIHLALYNNSEVFLKDDVYRFAKTPASSDEVTIVLTGIPFGEYAISIFHDENANDKMDMFMGLLPKEAYGFSNNVVGNMGPPTYDQSKFRVDKKDYELFIILDK